MFKKLLNLLHPNKLIKKVESNFQIIEIRTEFGKPRIVVDNMPQSGGIVQSILEKTLINFDNPKNFLLLGLGGGGILHEVHRNWPDCKITAIEIDSNMIKIAKKYFDVNQISNLIIYDQDAYDFVKSETKYDAILVDCYLGGNVPKKLESGKFLKNLKEILTNNGMVVFNRLYGKGESRKKTDEFIFFLNKFFPSVETYKAYCNMIITAKINL